MAAKRRNPFTPTFGHAPFAFAGRDDIIDDVIEGLENQPGNPNRATVLVGPRGSGKTVLANTIAKEALSVGWLCADGVARIGLLKDLMYALTANAKHIIDKPQPAALTSLTVGPIGLGWDRQESDIPWRFRFQDLVEKLNDVDVGVLFVIDEVDPDCDELSEFISIYQMFVGEGRDVAMLLAGLPSKVSDLLVDDHVSFVRRASQRRLHRVSDDAVREAFLKTVVEHGKTIDGSALDLAVQGAAGFPYAMQLVGYHAWRLAGEEPCIAEEQVSAAVRRAESEMELSVVRPTLRECSMREVEYLGTMAEMDGPCVTSEVAKSMGISMTNASNLRRRLIDRGIIVEVRMGLVDFDMAVFRTFLRNHPAEWRA